MFKPIISRLGALSCCIYLAAAIHGSAQSQPPPGRTVHLRLLAFDSESIPQESFAFEPVSAKPVAGVPAPIKSYLNHEFLSLRIAGNDIVFSKSSKPEDKGNAGLLIGKVSLPKSADRFLLVFLPGADHAYRILALDDSTKDFPLGSYRVISLSRFPVKMTLEDKAYDFKPGQSTVITDPPVQANNHSAMSAYRQIDGKWQQIRSGLWPAPGKKRSVQIFFDVPGSQATDLRAFRDVSPPSANSATAQTP